MPALPMTPTKQMIERLKPADESALRRSLKAANGREVPVPSALALPCPWCGKGAEIQPWHGGGPDKHYISCIGAVDDWPYCEVRPSVTGETLQEALDNWNTRATIETLTPSAAGEGVEPWIVWSNEHGAFWGPNRCGYTGTIEKAGRYSRAEAEKICRDACPRSNSTINIGTPPEICMPAPEAALTASPPNQPQPIPMLLYCPKCGLKHVDEPDERTPDWTNPPHRSHLCHGCGCIWRPAEVPTNGVDRIETKGSADTFGAEPSAAPASQPHPDIEGLAREILNRHCEYLNGLDRGQRSIGTDKALAAVMEALAGPTWDIERDATEAARAHGFEPSKAALTLPCAEIRREALEEAAKVAEASQSGRRGEEPPDYRSRTIAENIRSLASKEDGRS